MTATPAQRKAEKAYIKRLKASGMRARKFWLTDEEHLMMKVFLDEMRGGNEPEKDVSEPSGIEHHGQHWTADDLTAIVRAAGNHTGQRVYFLVPKAEKDAAKQDGAKWDSEAVAWYWDAPISDDISRKWLKLSDAYHNEIMR